MRFDYAAGILLLTLPTMVYTLQPPLERVSQPAGSSLSLNPSTPSLNTSTNSLPPIHCDGPKYGTRLNVASCRSALGYLPKSVRTDQLSFGNRLWGKWDIVVPNRYLSCMLLSFPILNHIG